MIKFTSTQYLIIGFACIIMFGIGIIIGNSKTIETQDKFTSPDDRNLALNWACTDGCYHMENIVLGIIDFNNKTQEKWINNCSKICYDQYMEKKPNG
jgi:hypothetical protein